MGSNVAQVQRDRVTSGEQNTPVTEESKVNTEVLKSHWNNNNYLGEINTSLSFELCKNMQAIVLLTSVLLDSNII